MPPKVKIALFEDMSRTRSSLVDALKAALGKDDSVVPFAAGSFNEADDKERTYDDRLEGILSKPPYDDVTLILADRDLSKSQDIDFGGLSVSAVSAAARKLSVPLCSYARELDKAYDWRGSWEEGHIVLSFAEGENELARKSVLAARGFAEIAERLSKADLTKRKSTADVLSNLLGKEEYADKMALYAVGDNYRLGEIVGRGIQDSVDRRKITHFLGYWLWDSLLRFPGVFVNEIAAGSYLNINTEDFAKPEVRSVFGNALYEGPFADPQAPQWWRGDLDDIVSAAKCNDGLELVRTTVDPNIDRSHCLVNDAIPAGYYCIISRLPVSLENSKGGLSWFPRGADLTRISNPKFEEYGPWLGV